MMTFIPNYKRGWWIVVKSFCKSLDRCYLNVRFSMFFKSGCHYAKFYANFVESFCRLFYQFAPVVDEPTDHIFRCGCFQHHGCQNGLAGSGRRLNQDVPRALSHQRPSLINDVGLVRAQLETHCALLFFVSYFPAKEDVVWRNVKIFFLCDLKYQILDAAWDSASATMPGFWCIPSAYSSWRLIEFAGSGAKSAKSKNYEFCWGELHLFSS